VVLLLLVLELHRLLQELQAFPPELNFVLNPVMMLLPLLLLEGLELLLLQLLLLPRLELLLLLLLLLLLQGLELLRQLLLFELQGLA
jgi:hypothetical protein